VIERSNRRVKGSVLPVRSARSCVMPSFWSAVQHTRMMREMNADPVPRDSRCRILDVAPRRVIASAAPLR
jgi:hypothetical protein